jgi:hypothetical protein
VSVGSALALPLAAGPGFGTTGPVTGGFGFGFFFPVGSKSACAAAPRPRRAASENATIDLGRMETEV